MEPLEERVAKVKGVLTQLQQNVQDLPTEIRSLRTEMRSEIQDLLTVMRSGIRDLRTQLRWLIGITVTMWATTVATVVASASFIPAKV